MSNIAKIIWSEHTSGAHERQTRTRRKRSERKTEREKCKQGMGMERGRGTCVCVCGRLGGGGRVGAQSYLWGGEKLH